MTTKQEVSKLDLMDTINANIAKSHSIAVMLNVALESSSRPNNTHLCNTAWALADLLCEAGKANDRLNGIELSNKRSNRD
jgi:hypothetical protein